MPAHSRHSRLFLELGMQLSGGSHAHALAPPAFTHESHGNNLKLSQTRKPSHRNEVVLPMITRKAGNVTLVC